MSWMRTVAAAGVLIALGLCGCRVSRYTQAQRQQMAIDHFVQGQLAIDADDDAAALEALFKAIEADPHLSTAHAAIGDIYRKRGDPEMAVRAYEKAVVVNAWNFRNHYNCASLHQFLADPSGAVDAMRRHLTRAIELYRRAIVLNKSDYDAQLNLGVCHFQLEQYDEAAAACRRAIELNADLPHAYTNMGAVLDRRGRNYDAINMYNKSLERDSGQPQVLMNLGAAYVRADKLTSAIRSYRQALELAPGSSEALERLGFCYFFRKDHAKALELYEAALAVDSQMALAHRGIGIVYMTQSIADSDNVALRQKGLDHWRKSLEIDPDQADLRTLLNKYSSP